MSKHSSLFFAGTLCVHSFSWKQLCLIFFFPTNILFLWIFYSATCITIIIIINPIGASLHGRPAAAAAEFPLSTKDTRMRKPKERKLQRAANGNGGAAGGDSGHGSRSGSPSATVNGLSSGSNGATRMKSLDALTVSIWHYRGLWAGAGFCLLYAPCDADCFVAWRRECAPLCVCAVLFSTSRTTVFLFLPALFPLLFHLGTVYPAPGGW